MDGLVPLKTVFSGLSLVRHKKDLCGPAAHEFKISDFKSLICCNIISTLILWHNKRNPCSPITSHLTSDLELYQQRSFDNNLKFFGIAITRSQYNFVSTSRLCVTEGFQIGANSLQLSRERCQKN